VDDWNQISNANKEWDVYEGCGYTLRLQRQNHQNYGLISPSAVMANLPSR